jgi:hypothetical protein
MSRSIEIKVLIPYLNLKYCIFHFFLLYVRTINKLCRSTSFEPYFKHNRCEIKFVL